MMNYIKLLKEYRKEISFLAYQQIKKQYLETAFGISWAVVKPMVFIFSFWFFFTFGLRSGSSANGTPYLLNIFAAYMPWFFISEVITSSSGVILGNKVLIQTIKFPVMALPLINVLAKLMVHIAVMCLVILFYMIYGGFSYAPDIYYINFIYYWITMIAFFTSLTFLLSSVGVVIKDVKPLIGAIMQPLFWITPVLYTPSTPMMELLMRTLDPLYFFIVGYKETLISEKFFFEDIGYDIYIWIIILIMFLIGIKFWNKIRPYMADLI